MSRSDDAVPRAEDYERSAELDLLASPLTASGARHAVREHLAEWGIGDDELDVAVLLTSEIITNASRHAPPPVHLVVRHGRPGIRVEVADSLPSLDVPQRRGVGDHGGRGVWLVENMSTRWGHHQHRDGKVVWFELQSTPGQRPE